MENEFTAWMMTFHHYLMAVKEEDVRIEFLKDFVNELKHDMLMVESNRGLE